MEINQPVKKHNVTDIDFIYTSGHKMPVTLDDKVGDTMTEHDDRYEIVLAAKPSMIMPDEMLAEERVTIFKRSLAAITRITREFVAPSLEEQMEFRKYIHESIKTVQ